MQQSLTPVFAKIGSSGGIRRKVFVSLSWPVDTPEGLKEAAQGCAAELYNQGVIDEGEFPVRVAVFEQFDSSDPVGEMLVDMDIRPVFQAYEIESEQ